MPWQITSLTLVQQLAGNGPGLAVIALLRRHVAVVAGVGLDQLVDLARWSRRA